MSIQIIDRTGWSLRCPFCGKDIKYTVINNQNPPVPFFYARDSNDVLLKRQHQKVVDEAFYKTTDRVPDIQTLEKLWRQFLEEAPSTHHGGTYDLWANVKCPNCFSEIPYNHGVKNLEVRIYEPRIILIDGSAVIGDSESESWRVNVTL